MMMRPYVTEPNSTRRAGGDSRGNSYQRRSRKRRLLARFGDGYSCPCAHCGASLTYASVESDRIIQGGSYAFANIVPSCRGCNLDRGDNPLWTPA